VSNFIFPSDVGTGTTGTNQWGFRLPFKKTPSYVTNVQTPVNNRAENRVSMTPYPIWKFDLDLAFMRGDFSQAQAQSIFQTILGFYGQVGGRAQDWLYADDTDNTVAQSNGVFGFGDGTTTQFQLQRQINGLNDIVQNLNGAPSIYVGGVLQTPFAGTGSAALYWIGQENLLLYSQGFDNAAWALGNSSASNPTVTANSTTAPDGTSTADTLAFPSTTGGKSSYIYQDVNIGPQGVTFTFSIWLKAASGTDQVTIVVGDNYTQFSATKSVTTTWTRFTITGTFSPASPSSQVYVEIASTGQSAYSIYAWGAQLERWASATGYLPTITAQLFPNGLVTFATAPAAGAKLTWTGNFYFRCRFDEDEWPDLEEFVSLIWSQSSFKFRSVIL